MKVVFDVYELTSRIRLRIFRSQTITGCNKFRNAISKQK